ncbi:hypothetical protein [Salarchaeum sp. JOR-1]|uniref:DUF7127 family protein n=1 Tax=Salarchaeum sp. JOR-1 TaxID=2599399 RepID=UPI0011985666|nr:hypothetical protein [Salarchaeum sp. JOR-1]QDX41639.1 hypothetical protein FQU85_12255 [Salarchaeum sp. JOR-1]
MNERTSVSESGEMVRQYDYDDRTIVAADLGTSADGVSVDVVDGTAILVADGEGEQREFDVPAGDVAKATITNGVVTIEVER